MKIVLGQDKFEFLGGTTTLLVDLASALLRQGHTIYYWCTDHNNNTLSITEQWFVDNNIEMYSGQKVDFAITCQRTATMFFLNKCPVLQLLNSKYTTFEFPVAGATHVAVTDEVRYFVNDKFNLDVPTIWNGIDLERYKPNGELHEIPRVLSICQGDDTLLKNTCNELGYEFKSVPKEVGSRIWNIEDLIKDADIVVGIGRSAMVGMACGKCVISWDNRNLNPNTGCGYITADNFKKYMRTNLTGRGFPTIDLKTELLKYNPNDGKSLREIAELALNADLNVNKYINELQLN